MKIKFSTMRFKKPVRTKVLARIIVALFVALTISCRGQGATQVSEFTEQTQSFPAFITLVNWNAQKGQNPQFSQDLKLILEQEKPDIVFLQEAKADLFEPQQMAGYFAEAWTYPWPGGEAIGVLTLSRIPAVRVQPVPTKYREFGVTAPKISLVTEYPLPSGKNLLAINVHLLNFERWSLKKITHQLEDLKKIMAAHSGPMIMAGDFNTWNDKRLSLVKGITDGVHLKEVTDFPEGRKTGNLNSEFWNKMLGIDQNLPLDRIFFKGFRSTEARILKFNSSDHAPILIGLHFVP